MQSRKNISNQAKVALEVGSWLLLWALAAANFNIAELFSWPILLMTAFQALWAFFYCVAKYKYLESKADYTTQRPKTPLKTKWVVGIYATSIVAFSIGILWVVVHPNDPRNLRILVQYI